MISSPPKEPQASPHQVFPKEVHLVEEASGERSTPR